MSRQDPIKEKLQEGPQNAKYTSPEIQNSLLGVLGGIARDTICNFVREAHVFSLLVDDTKDSSKVEQLATVCRYTDINTATIHERFLTCASSEPYQRKFVNISLIHWGNINDGASVMSGHCSGVQARIREVAPQAIYVHYNAHCLNLALVDSVKAVRDASEFCLPYLRLCMCSCLQQNVIQFFSNSRKNCILSNSRHSRD